MLFIGAIILTTVNMNTRQTRLMSYISVMGIGMGLAIPSFLIAVQTKVERRYLGTATSTIQFSRSIGGTLGVRAMGAALGARLASNLATSGLDPSLVGQLLDPLPGSETVINSSLRFAVADAIGVVFIVALVAAALSLVTVLFFTPRIQLTETSPSTTEEVPTPMIVE